MKTLWGLVLGFALAAPVALAETSKVDEGAYVAIAADCGSCHTSDSAKPFAGGLTIKTPFGPLVTPNITPDKNTGIGSWTQPDFERALRRGLDDGGMPLYPAMPYVSYTKMTDADVDALWAYMQSLAPINNKVDVNQLPFPFDVRASLFAWQALFFTPGRFQPDAVKGAEYNRGAYLVNALEHCTSCHTPRNVMGALDNADFLQGATLQEWYAPNISNDTASVIRSWSKERLTQFLEGHSDESLTPPFGPMAEVVYNSTSKLKPEDVAAIAAYLKERPEAASPAVAESPVTFDREAAGRQVFMNSCAECHGPEGEGKAGVAAKLAGNEAITTASPNNILSVLIEGIVPRGIWGEMPSFANALSNQEIADVANYVRTAWGNKGVPNVTVHRVAAWRTFASAPSAVLERAMTCPAIPATWLDDTVRQDLDQLGMGKIDQSKVRQIYESYAKRFPDLSVENRIMALTATYCRDAARKLPTKTAVIHQQLDLAYALGLAAWNKGSGKP